MDENDQKSNVDGIRPPEPQAPVSNVDGFVTNPRPDSSSAGQNPSPYTNRFENQNVHHDEANQDGDTQAQVPAHEVETAKLKAEKKGLSVWIVILLIILFAGAAAAAVYFWQSAQAKSDLDAEKAKTSQATKQQIDQLTATNADLTAQNASLQKTIETQQAYITSLGKIATQLKATCGKSCDSIIIPPAPTPTPTPTPSATPTPAAATPTPAASVTPTPTPAKTN